GIVALGDNVGSAYEGLPTDKIGVVDTLGTTTDTEFVRRDRLYLKARLALEIPEGYSRDIPVGVRGFDGRHLRLHPGLSSFVQHALNIHHSDVGELLFGDFLRLIGPPRNDANLDCQA